MAESNKIKNKLQIMLKKCLNINSCNALEYTFVILFFLFRIWCKIYHYCLISLKNIYIINTLLDKIIFGWLSNKIYVSGKIQLNKSYLPPPLLIYSFLPLQMAKVQNVLIWDFFQKMLFRVFGHINLHKKDLEI